MYIINELEIVDTDKQTTIVNLINGNADLIEESVAKKIRNKNYKDIDIKYQEELIKRKYAFLPISFEKKSTAGIITPLATK